MIAQWIGSDKLLASVVRREIEMTGKTQREICAEVGVTEKHLSSFLNGRSGMMLDLVDAILGACGRVLVFSTLPMPDVEFRVVLDDGEDWPDVAKVGGAG